MLPSPNHKRIYLKTKRKGRLIALTLKAADYSIVAMSGHPKGFTFTRHCPNHKLPGLI